MDAGSLVISKPNRFLILFNKAVAKASGGKVVFKGEIEKAPRECRDGEPLCTLNFDEGMEITIVVLPSPEIWQTKKGVKCFGHRHFGFNIDYKPFF